MIKQKKPPLWLQHRNGKADETQRQRHFIRPYSTILKGVTQ